MFHTYDETVDTQTIDKTRERESETKTSYLAPYLLEGAGWHPVVIRTQSRIASYCISIARDNSTMTSSSRSTASLAKFA